MGLFLMLPTALLQVMYSLSGFWYRRLAQWYRGDGLGFLGPVAPISKSTTRIHFPSGSSIGSWSSYLQLVLASLSLRRGVEEVDRENLLMYHAVSEGIP